MPAAETKTRPQKARDEGATEKPVVSEPDISGHPEPEDQGLCAIILGRDKLSIEQQNAIELLLTGKTDQEVGELVGVTRQTVSRWRHHHFLFQATLNLRRELLWDAHAQRLRHLMGRAVEVLDDNLDSEDERLRLAAAVHVLKATGLYGADLRPRESTDQVQLETMWMHQEKFHLLERRMADRLSLDIVKMRDEEEDDPSGPTAHRHPDTAFRSQDRPSSPRTTRR